jgi:hypothetical protein
MRATDLYLATLRGARKQLEKASAKLSMAARASAGADQGLSEEELAYALSAPFTEGRDPLLWTIQWGIGAFPSSPLSPCASLLPPLQSLRSYSLTFSKSCAKSLTPSSVARVSRRSPTTCRTSTPSSPNACATGRSSRSPRARPRVTTRSTRTPSRAARPSSRMLSASSHPSTSLGARSRRAQRARKGRRCLPRPARLPPRAPSGPHFSHFPRAAVDVLPLWRRSPRVSRRPPRAHRHSRGARAPAVGVCTRARARRGAAARDCVHVAWKRTRTRAVPLPRQRAGRRRRGAR